MALAELILTLAIGASFRLTMGFVGFSTVWLSVQLRRIPTELLLQLRVYMNHGRLSEGLLALGIGTLSGLRPVIPSIVVFDPFLSLV